MNRHRRTFLKRRVLPLTAAALLLALVISKPLVLFALVVIAAAYLLL